MPRQYPVLNYKKADAIEKYILQNDGWEYDKEVIVIWCKNIVEVSVRANPGSLTYLSG